MLVVSYKGLEQHRSSPYRTPDVGENPSKADKNWIADLKLNN